MNTLSKGFNQLVKSIRANRSTIAFIFGAGTAITGTIMACRATLDLGDILDEHKEAMEEIRENVEKEDLPKETAKQYAKTVGKVALLYLPSFTALGVGYGCMTYSQYSLKKSNIGLAASVVSLENELRRTKDVIKDELGEEEANRIFNGGKKILETIEEVDEDGKTHKRKNEKIVYKDRPLDPYAILFDESNTNWEKSDGWNYRFILKQLEFAQLKLDKRGWLTLNEMYDLLGYKRIADGFSRGWTSEDACGNRRIIDLGLNTPRAAEFRNGKDRNVWLTFNIDELPLGTGMSNRVEPDWIA